MFDFLRKQTYLPSVLSFGLLLLLFEDSETTTTTSPWELMGIDPTTFWIMMACSTLLTIFMIAGMWKVFTKAGQPGWACLIPIYNVIVLLRIARKPGWWFFLLLIPLVDIYFLFVISIEIARNFGQGTGFGIGLVLLSFIFYPILGFGSARYLAFQSPQFQQPMYGGGYS